MNAIGRLAPSPTGAQHLGNARTYLLAFWSAQASGAKLILRIEDIDSPRVKPWAAEQAVEDLKWLGIFWNEGPDVGGPHAPYIQTQRVKLYAMALRQLIDNGHVYPCVCTRRDIETAASAPHAGDEGPIYPGTCSKWQVGDRLPEQGNYCWRFRSRDQPQVFVDRVAGSQRCIPKDELGDFPITRKTGEAAYQLAVVVDDDAMGVTEVVRGDDLLVSTFRQLELYQALNLRSPNFAHVPLVVGTDGRRLAKRHGDTRLSLYREQGVDSRNIVRWAAASAGLSIAEVSTSDSLETMHDKFAAQFNWQLLSREAIVIDSEAISFGD